MEETRCLFVEIVMVIGKVGESVLEVPMCLKPDAACVQLVLCASGLASQAVVRCFSMGTSIVWIVHDGFFPLKSPCTRTESVLERPLSCCLTLKGSKSSIQRQGLRLQEKRMKQWWRWPAQKRKSKGQGTHRAGIHWHGDGRLSGKCSETGI